MIDEFLLKKILSIFIHLIPGALLLLLITLLARRWLPRFCNSLATVICIGLIAASTPPVSNYFVANLENRFPVLQTAPTDTAVILVLGYGHRYQEDRPANSVLSSIALSRLMEGVRLWQTRPDAFLAVSGAGFAGHTSQAEASANMAIKLGVPAKQILLFDRTQDTIGEIRTASERISAMIATQSDTQPNDSKRLIVVSSALHLPRVSLMIQKYRLTYSLAPTDFNAIEQSWYLPDSGYLFSLDLVIHEWAGMLWYRLWLKNTDYPTEFAH